MKRRSHKYHKFAVSSNKVTVTLFLIYSFTYDPGVRDLVLDRYI